MTDNDASGTTSRPTWWMSFDRVALLVGFVVDSITLVSILIAASQAKVGFSLPAAISPGFTFGVWILGTYIYLAFLHRHWELNAATNKFRRSFGEFLLYDLVLAFRFPWLLFPAVICLVTLFGVTAYADAAYKQSTGANLDFTICLTVPVVVGAAILAFFRAIGYLNSISVGPADYDKQVLLSKWKLVEKHIATEMETFIWMRPGQLVDFATLHDIPTSTIELALAKFAMDNPKAFRYGFVRAQRGHSLVSGEVKVLINLKSLDRSKYYWT